MCALAGVGLFVVWVAAMGIMSPSSMFETLWDSAGLVAFFVAIIVISAVVYWLDSKR